MGRDANPRAASIETDDETDDAFVLARDGDDDDGEDDGDDGVRCVEVDDGDERVVVVVVVVVFVGPGTRGDEVDDADASSDSSVSPGSSRLETVPSRGTVESVAGSASGMSMTAIVVAVTGRWRSRRSGVEGEERRRRWTRIPIEIDREVLEAARR